MNIHTKIIWAFLIKEPVLKYIQIENSLLHAIVRLAFERRILMRKNKRETDLIQWMRFLGGKNRKDLKRMAEKNSNIQEAYNELDRLSADEKKRLEYEARQKALRDKNILLKTGENRGIEKGERIGLEKGERIGLEKGAQATLEKLILSMLKEQLSLDKISSITGESLEEIQTLGKKHGLL